MARYIESHDVTTMTYVGAGVMFRFCDSIKSISATDVSIDIPDWTIILGFVVDSLRGAWESGADLVGLHVCTHHRGRLASSEFRMAAWRAPSRGVDWTAPHPAINKLAEREQPRDEPFNSATFCLPFPFYVFSSPLAIALLSRFPPPVRPARCSSAVTLAISDSARAFLLRFATR